MGGSSNTQDYDPKTGHRVTKTPQGYIGGESASWVHDHTTNQGYWETSKNGQTHQQRDDGNWERVK